MGEKTPERIALEEKAQQLGLSFPVNIGDEKLAERVAEAEARAKETPPPPAAPPAATGAAPAGVKDGTPAEPPQEEAAATKDQVGAPADTPQEDGTPADPANPPGLAVIEVHGPARGRWRAGRHFGPEAVVLDLAALSEAELALIRADPLLVVVDRELPAA